MHVVVSTINTARWGAAKLIHALNPADRLCLRTLIYVGAKAGRLSTISEIAESFDVSKTHLMKVVSKLGQQGYIGTARSRCGGIRLRRPPAQIAVGAIIRETEEALAVMDDARQGIARFTKRSG
jgi:Rrf2 family nitric oxide-sensitive transcriptional repressor